MHLRQQLSHYLDDDISAGRPGPARAVLLVGHGSLRAGAGAAMIRLAERVRAAGVAPIVNAGFLNYRRPTFAEALDRCVADGAGKVIVQPYFLVPGKYVHDDLARLVEAGRLAHPDLPLHMAGAFGDHPALARLVLKRALEADYLAANPHITRMGLPRPIEDGADWRPLHQQHRTGLLIMAHGSPDPSANAPIYRVARQVRASGRYAAVTVCFMELNRPAIGEAVDDMSARGIKHIIAAPYFLHLGNHVAKDLPARIENARQQHPSSIILLSEHLSYDRLLLSVIADRVGEADSLAPAEALH
jgi:sirohydrochlorin cobaltochelatase